MAELADALDLGSSGAIHAGSIPVIRTRLSLDAFCVPGLAFSFLLVTRIQAGISLIEVSYVGASFIALAPIFYKNQSAFITLLSSCAKVLASFACSFVNTLTTALGRYHPFAVLTPYGRLLYK